MPTDFEVQLFKDRAGNLTVPISVEADLLVQRLESRGVVLAADGIDILASPRGALTEAERGALRRLRPYVLRILTYQPPAVH